MKGLSRKADDGRGMNDEICERATEECTVVRYQSSTPGQVGGQQGPFGKNEAALVKVPTLSSFVN